MSKHVLTTPIVFLTNEMSVYNSLTPWSRVEQSLENDKLTGSELLLTDPDISCGVCRRAPLMHKSLPISLQVQVP
ncbi:MAG: hypothetical protein N3B18_05655 [Desulfobacterota bacterium]|nr:hypothetical protein [Thermodesulfobacteriota bacterium]